MAATIGDCNGDGYEDILVTRLGYGSLYMGTTNGVYEDRMMASGLGALTAQFVGWGGCFLDFDNSGKLDIFIANGDPHYLVGWESLLLENRGDGTFTDAAAKGGAYFTTKVRARGSAVADYDNDGRMDIIVTAMGDRPFLLHNRDKSGNHWLTLDLEGTKSNRDGFGAKVKVTAGGKTYFAEARCAFGFLMQSDRRLALRPGQGNDRGPHRNPLAEQTGPGTHQRQGGPDPQSPRTRRTKIEMSMSAVSKSLSPPPGSPCWPVPAAANPSRPARWSSRNPRPPPPTTAASDILALRYPPGSRVVLMEAPFDSKRVQVLSEGLAAAGEPVVSYDGQRVFFAGKSSDAGEWQIYQKTWRAGVLKC